MTDEAIGTLIARRIGAASVPQEVVDFVRERAAGNPYYSEEVAAILLDAGRLTVADGQCTVAGPLEDLSMDGSLESVIASRVDLLKPPEQYTVKVASVQGRRVAYEMLSGVRHLNPEEPPLPDQIAELTRREILLPLEDDPTWQFLFKHLITQQAIYNRLLFAQRRELHRAVAEWMEEHLAGEVNSHLAVIGIALEPGRAARQGGDLLRARGRTLAARRRRPRDDQPARAGAGIAAQAQRPARSAARGAHPAPARRRP